METETPNAEGGSELPLTEPHFDDEATVLSARRVVPLDEAGSYEPQSRSRVGRAWIFAATMSAAVLIGVAGSTIYFSRINRTTDDPFAGRESIGSGVDAISTEPVRDNNTNAPAVDNAAATQPNAIVKEDPGSAAPGSRESKLPVARRVDVVTFPSTRAELKAARRLARKKELERESRNRKSRDDLTRIREIFEGPQKP